MKHLSNEISRMLQIFVPVCNQRKRGMHTLMFVKKKKHCLDKNLLLVRYLFPDRIPTLFVLIIRAFNRSNDNNNKLNRYFNFIFSVFMSLIGVLELVIVYSNKVCLPLKFVLHKE